MSYQPVGQQTRPNKTTKPVPPKPTKIPKHDSAQKHHNPLKINRPLPQFYRYEMAVFNIHVSKFSFAIHEEITIAAGHSKALLPQACPFIVGEYYAAASRSTSVIAVLSLMPSSFQIRKLFSCPVFAVLGGSTVAAGLPSPATMVAFVRDFAPILAHHYHNRDFQEGNFLLTSAGRELVPKLLG